MDSSPYQPPAAASTLSIVSLIAGIASWSIVPFIGALVAIVTGHMAKKEIRESNGTLGGNHLATAGLILGYASLGMGIALGCFILLALIFGFSILGITLQNLSLPVALFY